MSECWVRGVSLAAFFVLLISAPVLAADPYVEARRDAQHRINVSGRQRMLSQRIAKAACLATRSPENGEQLREMFDAQTLFVSSAKALRGGSAEIRLAPEQEADLLPVLEAATQLADQYNAAVSELAAAFPAKPYQEKLETIYELSLPVLSGLNDAVEQLEAKHEDGHLIRLGLANALNVSGRQRMLSQKMSKELCMLASGYKPQDTRAHMRGTVALFVSSHERLKRGLKQMELNEKDASAISSQLALIERHWQELGNIFVRVSEGGNPSEDDVKTVASGSKSFLAELNHAVELYEVIDTGEGPVSAGSKQ